MIDYRYHCSDRLPAWRNLCKMHMSVKSKPYWPFQIDQSLTCRHDRGTLSIALETSLCRIYSLDFVIQSRLSTPCRAPCPRNPKPGDASTTSTARTKRHWSSSWEILKKEILESPKIKWRILHWDFQFRFLIWEFTKFNFVMSWSHWVELQSLKRRWEGNH